MAACTDLPRGFDPFPIHVQTAGGAILAQASAAPVGSDDGDAPPFAVAVDILAPVSTLDLSGDGGARRVLVDLTLHGWRDGASIPRARFERVPILDIAACASPPCTLGSAGEDRPIVGVLGADLLGDRAVRIDFPSAEVHFFPDIAGNANDHGRQCEAVMHDPYAGGGTLLVDGAEFNYLGRRPVLGACLAASGPSAMVESGTDAVLALSTGIGQSVLAASAWDRLALATGGTPAAELPRTTLELPAGPVEVGAGTIPRMALLGDLGAESERRGPCRELLINRMMSEDTCERLDLEGDECPCVGDAQRCAAAAAIELDVPLPVAVLEDGHPLLQGLRDELRPTLAEIDGIVGADALAAVRLDLDYPNDRLLLKCLDVDACTGRPQLLDPGQTVLRELIAVCHDEPTSSEIDPDAGGIQ